ncbi:MAG: hypothetical protein GY790_11025, partial [Bacteroidetes bacterium]|nr:hypothetical protein [Bacteroidota bacterium]
MKNNRNLVQKSIAISVFSFIAILAFAQTEGQKVNSGNPFGLSAEKVQWLKEATLKQL